jgi:hypothetical protein
MTLLQTAHAALASWKIPCTDYVLQCPGLADIRHQFGAVDDAASNLEYGVAPHTAMKLLFNIGNFADLAGYLSRAYKRRFSANNHGVEAMKAVAAGRDRWMMWLPCRRSRMRRRIVDLALLCSSLFSFPLARCSRSLLCL